MGSLLSEEGEESHRCGEFLRDHLSPSHLESQLSLPLTSLLSHMGTSVH